MVFPIIIILSSRFLREVLEEVRENVPKVFVNLVLMGNISEV